MKIFDIHTHIFPAKIAQKASDNIGRFYDVPMAHDGSAEKLLQMMQENGIAKSLIFSAATTVEQVSHINDFIHTTVQENADRFVGFFTLHPHMKEEKLADEFNRTVGMGLNGIKLHPDFQNFAIDDECTFPMYELAQQQGIPVVFHAGDPRHAYSNPHRIANILRLFPHLVVVAAHFGGWGEWEAATQALAGFENVLADTSSTRGFTDMDTVRKGLRFFGADRLMFGTDYPMWDAKEELQFIDSLPITQEEKEKILYKNACALLNIEL
ncbi:MAG: amidohydrolase [Clostridia bacterium]|nr:amidohydrolase [Clostridia bacterium]